FLTAIANAEKRTARANMQTIATAEQAYWLQNPARQYLIGDSSVLFNADTGLKDLGGAVAGPGDRTYTVLGPGASCNPTPDPNKPPVTVSDGSFAVQSSHVADGCYIPGISTE